MDYNYGIRYYNWRWIKETFKTVLAMWREDTSRNSKKGGGQDDEVSWGFEGGYSTYRGRSRHSLDWQNGKLRENTSGESEEDEEGHGVDFDGDYQRKPPLFVVAKVGDRDMNSANVVESPAKNTRKRKSNIPAVDSHAMDKGEKGHNRQWRVCFGRFIGFCSR